MGTAKQIWIKNKNDRNTWICFVKDFECADDKSEKKIQIAADSKYRLFLNGEDVVFEGGLKRLGSKKNIKVGVISHYTITDKHGFSGLNCVVSNILPYAEWSTQFAIGYGKKYTNTIFMLGTSLTLSLDY